MFTYQNISLLYINHDFQLREIEAAFMRKNGLHVLTADNTARAYEFYQIHQFDIIILDLPLPGENGLDFIRQLRYMEISIPVIITTDKNDQEILLEAINLDISRCLIKPIDTFKLMDALESTIKKIPIGDKKTFVNLHHGFSYDKINKSVNRPDGTTAQLTQKEYQLLELLLENNRKIVPYKMIESTLWENSTMSIDALRTLIRAVRKKTYPDIITNNNAIGYKINI
ncbi:response regulator transcription factor [Sulfuricurvum sp.]|uniref:response regulator transcription factor n=1 Tax=Sulfuricurvum sp. TaxID=2025608 RepID=UPI003BAE972A